MKRWIGLVIHLAAPAALVAAAVVPPPGPWLPGIQPGPAAIVATADTLIASNAVLAARWTRDAKTGWSLASLANGPAGKALTPPPHELFTLTLGDGASLRASALRAGTPRVEDVPAAPGASCFARRQPGRRVVIPFTSDTPPLDLEWSALFRDGATYVQPALRIRARGAAVVREVTLWDLFLPGAEVVGQVDGSPVVVQNACFLALESPNAQTRADASDIVFRWRADNVQSGIRTVSVPLDARRLTPGSWTADFRYQSGPHRLDIRSVALLRNGAEISRDAHDGYAGIPSSKNSYQLTVDRADPAAVWTLALDIGGTESPLNSAGEVSFMAADVAGGLPSTDNGMRRVCASLPFEATLAAGDELTASAAAGIALPGQLRRSFLYYVERERAHPWRPYLHYNSWFDLSWGGYPMTADACVEAVRLFGENLIRPYGLHFDGFVLDDGWDDPATLWGFNTRFPNGFTPIAAAARTYGAALGAWLSPFGGYGSPKEERLAYGRKQGYETNESGFSMSGPKYYARYRDICREMIRTYNVDYFKFDGLGGGSRVSGSGGVYLRDTEAMRRLMLELRETRPDLFINLTTGSWPSPFWLWYADSLWRQGHDTSFAGVGSRQQQWLTYRDGETYHSIVLRAPLYPISSLMSHGIVYSRHGHAADPTFTSDGLRDDIRDYFGSGTCLQEMYLQPQRLQPQDWKNLAEAIRWSQANNDLFPDTHWIGGDPLKLEVYGWAYWSPRKGAFTLRNPSDAPRTYAVRLADIFELPAGAPTVYRLTPVWTQGQPAAPIRATAGETVTLTLRPFEILTLDAWPQ